MRARRGVALLAALWLVVAIAAVALQFSLEARERRTIGILASERGIQRAAALGALALMQARLEYALRVGAVGGQQSRTRASARDRSVARRRFASSPVRSWSTACRSTSRSRDLGEKLNINRMTENELQHVFQLPARATTRSRRSSSQAIMDWRDADSIPRPSGAERDAYIKAEMLALPTNAPFREIEELQNVMGMTPEIYASGESVSHDARQSARST